VLVYKIFITVFQLTCRSIAESRVGKLFFKGFRNGLFHKEFFSDVFYFKFYDSKIYIYVYNKRENKFLQIFSNWRNSKYIKNYANHKKMSSYNLSIFGFQMNRKYLSNFSKLSLVDYLSNLGIRSRAASARQKSIRGRASCTRCSRRATSVYLSSSSSCTICWRSSSRRISASRAGRRSPQEMSPSLDVARVPVDWTVRFK